MNMATYPIKVLKDETGVPFVPLVSSTGITSPDGTTLEDSLSVKLESGNIIAGDNIILTKKGNDITITGTASGAANKVIDNLTTTESNIGVLDAHQGYVLNNKITEMAETLEGGIPQVINNCATVDTINALSAYQGYLLNNKFNDYLPLSGGTLNGELTLTKKITGSSGHGIEFISTDLGSWNEGVRIYDASNGYSLLYCGNTDATSGVSLVHYNPDNLYFLDVIKDGSARRVQIPYKAGTIALLTDTVAGANNADTVDGVHEHSFLRYRSSTGTGGENTFWSQIGIKEYDGALPDGMSSSYNYGAVISLPGANTRLDLWYNHQSSGSAHEGLQYRSGWVDDKKAWRKLLDSTNYYQWVPKVFVQSSTPTATKAGDIWVM